MAKSPAPQTEVLTADPSLPQPIAAEYDPDSGIAREPGDAAVPPEDIEPPAEKSLEDRVAFLETLCSQYFGTHHFEAPAPVFDPEAERQAARAAFERDMRDIEERARAGKPN